MLRELLAAERGWGVMSHSADRAVAPSAGQHWEHEHAPIDIRIASKGGPDVVSTKDAAQTLIRGMYAADDLTKPLLVVLTDTDEKKWAEALLAARQTLATGAKPHRTAPDYDAKAQISQEQHRLKKGEIEALLSDYRGGMSTYQLAAKWRLNRHTVTAILDRNGVRQRSYAAKITEAEITEAQALRADGWSMNALARRYGIHPMTMKKRLANVMDGCE